MLEPSDNKELPPITAKKYFTIGEVAVICDVKPHVLRYWEQEFDQLTPVTRRGNRRYYQQHDILLICVIRDLLYREGFTISGAVQRLSATTGSATENKHNMLELQKIRHGLEDILRIIESQ